ncbi:thiamine pyrophosphokinase [Palleronia aestuarii]|uniref:Thiamine diphosphokinase n=1 Tax=Palleronia aestuarii TaxID=568105 RepID=A0A2W7NH16_9RHOB|nr:thiamine diphosphokinase [Palleronia aestuarii]PZX19711.1 thiamine pyrophosphokinase [Palleronia aestuarii]
MVLVGGGAIAPGDLDLALALGPTAAAADGGAMALLEHGVIPKAVIGDLDSLPRDVAARIPAGRIHHVPEQDSTDLQKCLARIDAPFVIGIGFLGARFDHSLAACHAIAMHDRPCLLLGSDDVVFHAAGALSLDLARGTRVSVFPMRPVTARSRGLEWPLDGIEFSPGERIGTSNMANGPVRIEPDGAGLLVLLPRSEIDAALAGLMARSDEPGQS